MLPTNDSFHVHNSGRIVYSDDSNGKDRRRYRRKTATRTRRKNALREHPFLPKEITDKIISFAGSFGLKVILAAKVGKLICSSRPVNKMTARCCIYYVDNEGLKVGLAVYRKGKVSLADSLCANKTNWLKSFELSYNGLARDVQYSVLSGALEPVVVPGLFLKNSNVKCC